MAAAGVVVFGELQAVGAEAAVAGRAFGELRGHDAQVGAAAVVVSALVFGNCRKERARNARLQFGLFESENHQKVSA